MWYFDAIRNITKEYKYKCVLHDAVLMEKKEGVNFLLRDFGDCPSRHVPLKHLRDSLKETPTEAEFEEYVRNVRADGDAAARRQQQAVPAAAEEESGTDENESDDNSIYSEGRRTTSDYYSDGERDNDEDVEDNAENNNEEEEENWDPIDERRQQQQQLEIQEPDSWLDYDDNGIGAIHCAAMRDSIPILETLLEHNAHVDAHMNTGETALVLALASGKSAIARVLLKHGADPNLATDWGKTALHYACERGSKKIVKLLFKKGADFKAKTWNDMTAMHFAAKGGHVNVIAELVRRGANWEVSDRKGATPVHFAAAYKREAVLVFFADKGCSLRDLLYDRGGRLDLGMFEFLSGDDLSEIDGIVRKCASSRELRIKDVCKTEKSGMN